MNRRVWLLSTLLGSLLARGAGAADLPPDCMPISDVRVGMVGEARSVVHGFEVVKYRVEVIGIETAAMSGTPLILAKVEGPSLEMHGIVAGMSGSPVYIDGKLVGAIAYGWSFSYRPLAGITPIERMFTIWDDLDQKKPKPPRGGKGAGARGGAANKGWDWKPDWEAYLNGGAAAKPEPLSFRPTAPGLIDFAGEGPIELQPLSTPMFISHASPASMDRLGKFFAARGLETLAAGSSAGSETAPAEPAPPMVDGSAIGIPFVSGDLSIASMGTVTYRRGDKLLAFGHPMFGDGLIDAPMAQASMIGYMQSYMRSFKLGVVREEVGTIRQDRQFAIGGVFGESPERVGVTAKVGGPSAFYPRDYKYSVWEDRDFLPMMAATTMDESFASSVSGGELTADCRYTIKLAGGDKIEKTLRASARTGVTTDFFMGMLQDMFILINNPYGQVDVDSIDVALEARPGFRIDAMIQAEPRYEALQPGEKLEIDTLWRPYRGEEYEKRLSIDLPKDLVPGPYVVHIADGAGSMGIDQRHEPSKFRPLDIAESIALAKRLDYPSNRLTVYLFAPDLNISLRGDSLQGAPDTIRGLIATTAPEDNQMLMIGKEILAERTEFEHPIKAQASFTIDVQRRVPR